MAGLKKELIDLFKEKSGVPKARLEKEAVSSTGPGRTPGPSAPSKPLRIACLSMVLRHKTWASQRHMTDGNLRFVSVRLF